MRPNSIWNTLVAGFVLAITNAPAAQAQQRMLCVHGLEAPQALNVRSAAGYDAPVVGRFPAKACGVKLAGRCASEWCVMSLGGQSGWVNTRYIAVYDVPEAYKAATVQPIPPPAAGGAERRIVQSSGRDQGSRGDGACVARVESGDTLRIRTGPGVGNDAIDGIPPGACGVSRVGECKGLWCRIAWRGRTGWVNTHYLD